MLSKTLSLDDKLEIVNQEVKRILGRYTENTQVIRDMETFHNYITKAIENGVIAIDTETNNSLQPITCKLMGPCIYTPGMKNVYIPVNHVDKDTGQKLPNQITEEQIKEEFSRLKDTKIIMHNAKFDYEVIKCTCDIALNIYWDTMVAARILDENEKSAGLKQQYIEKIDSSVEKYSIDHLFKNIEYAVVDPEIFALYAATDSYMTYKLYKWQEEKYNEPDNAKLKELLLNIEMPIVTVAAEMELTGVQLDMEYAQRLHNKYKKLSDEIEEEISKCLQTYLPKIEEWRKTEDANFHPLSKKPNKDGVYTQQKSKNELFNNPPQLRSPQQLAILLYDVLNLPVVDKNSPRGTGEEILVKYDELICKLMLKKRGLDKLIDTYVDKLPQCVCEKDGRLHAKFNQVGTQTGRFSCISEGTTISMPGGNKEIQNVVPGDYLYCFDVNTNTLKLSTVKNVWYTGERECVKIKWASKYNHCLQGELICTPDHFIRTTTRGWVMAKDLTPNDSILYVHRRNNENSVSLYANFGQGDEEEHVWLKKHYFEVQDSKMEIHHKDRNRLNNDPRNLVIGTKKTHSNCHLSSGLPEDDNYCGRYNFSYEDLMKMGNSVNWCLSKLPYDKTTCKNWFKLHRINYILYYTESYSKRGFEKNGNKVYKHLHLPLNKDNLQYALELSNGDTVLSASYFGISQDEFIKCCDKFQLLSNHTVTCIEYLPGTRRVYDIEVNNYHNFIAGELCVHNSSEPNLQNIPAKEKSIRMMFMATKGNFQVPEQNGCFHLNKWDKVQTQNGVKYAKDLLVQDSLIIEEQLIQITSVVQNDCCVDIYI